jgi:transcriptional regulator with XRE-family HTH domain
MYNEGKPEGYPAGVVIMENQEKRSDPVCRAVRALRESIGETQQQFANRLHIAISTAVRYELTRPPRGEALVQFINLAATAGQAGLADFFRKAFVDQIGYDLAPPGPSEKCGLPEAPGELQEVEYLRLILRAAHVGLPGFDRQRAIWYQLRQPIAEEGVKRATIRALIGGLYQEVSRRIERGETDEAIVSAASADPDIVKKMIARLRRGSSADVDQELISELMSEAA